MRALSAPSSSKTSACWSRREQNAKSAGASGVRTWVGVRVRVRGRVRGRCRVRVRVDQFERPTILLKMNGV